MEVALKRTYDATPDPKLVVAIGELPAMEEFFSPVNASAGRAMPAAQSFQCDSGGCAVSGCRRLPPRFAGNFDCDQRTEIKLICHSACAE